MDQGKRTAALPDRRHPRSLLRRPAPAILAVLLLGLVLLVPIGALSATGTGQQAGVARGTGHITHAIELSAATTPTAWGWGNDPGNGSSNNKSPVKATTGSKASNLPPGATVTEVAAGSNGSAMALTSDGYVYAWGNNQYGQLGYKTSGEGGADVYYSPLKVYVPGTVTAIAMGADFGLALNALGDLYAWGYAANGELGDNSLSGNDACAKSLKLTGEQCQNTPVEVGLTSLPEGQAVEGIAAEGNDALLMTTDGTVYVWGDDTYGELGNGLAGNACSGTCQDILGSPVSFSLPNGVAVQGISGGGAFALARTSAGTVYGWGDNRWGQLGTGGFTGNACNDTCDNTPVESSVPGTVTVTSVSAGFEQGMAATSTGALYTWGDNTVGELGNGTTTGTTCQISFVCDPTPATVPNLPSVSEISGGDQFSLAVTPAGAAYAWGSTADGELGNNTLKGNACSTACQDAPILNKMPVVGICSTCTAIAAGKDQSAAIAAPPAPTGEPPCTEQGPPSTCEQVPTATIPDDCSVDVTQALDNWMNTLPAGTPTAPLEVQFAAGGCYLINGMIFLRGVTDVIFNGNGATFEQQSVASPIDDSPPTTVDPYCGVTNNFGGAAKALSGAESGNPPTDVMWYVEGGCDLEFENMNFAGANPGGGGGSYQQDSAMQISGGQRVLVTGDTFKGSYGDCVTVFGLHEYATPGTYPAADVTVAANTCNSPGRDGVAIVYANRVSVGGTSTTAGNTINSPAATDVDLESDCGDPAGGQGNILIENNTMTGAAQILNGTTNAQLYQLAFDDNTVQEMKVFIEPISGSGGCGKAIPGQNITANDNTASAIAGWASKPADWNIYGTIGGLLYGNTTPMCLSSQDDCADNPKTHLPYTTPFDFLETAADANGDPGGGFEVANNSLNGNDCPTGGGPSCPTQSGQEGTLPVEADVGPKSGDSSCDNFSSGNPGSNPFPYPIDANGNFSISPCVIYTPLQPAVAQLPDLPGISDLLSYEKPAMPSTRPSESRDAAKSASPDVSGPGNETCSKVTGTVNFDPPLQNGGTASSEMVLVHLTISDCTASNGAGTPTQGNASVELPLATNNCTTLSAGETVAPTSLGVSWAPSTVGTSQVVFKGFTPKLGTNPSIRLGSSTSSTYGQLNAGSTTAALKSACASAAGLASLSLSTGATATPLGTTTASS